MNNKENKKIYKLRFEIIQQYINQWDPINLIKLGCGTNEYDMEVAKILTNIVIDIELTQFAKIIFQVFLEMFGENTFYNNLEDCKIVAEQILKDARWT